MARLSTWPDCIREGVKIYLGPEAQYTGRVFKGKCKGQPSRELSGAPPQRLL